MPEPTLQIAFRGDAAYRKLIQTAALDRNIKVQEFLENAVEHYLHCGATKRSISSTNTSTIPVGDDPLLTAISSLKGNRRAMVAIQALVEALTGRDLNDETENLDRAAAAARSLGETVEKARTAVRKTTTRKGA